MLGALPASAQQLLSAIALSAQPVTASVAAAAARLDGDPRRRAARAARRPPDPHARECRERRELEPYHDRIRETIRRTVSIHTLAAWHARLAAAWESSGLARPETLVTHYRGAGDLPHTAQYAAPAADAAEEALAFQRAADYYRLLLDVDEPAQRCKWSTHLGDALANAGRGRDAATAYLDALHDATPDTAIELERRAAEQLIRAGYLDQAAQVLDSLLPKIGVRPPRTEAGAFAGLVVRRLALGAAGNRLPRAARTRPPHRRTAPDRCLVVDRRAAQPRGAGARQQPSPAGQCNRALRAGEPKRVVRALATLACASAIAGSHRRRDATARILDAGEAAGGTHRAIPTSIARTALAEAICHKVLGRWVLARAHLERAIEQLTPCRGVRWEIETARTLLHDTLFWMGDWKRLFNEIPGAAARSRGLRRSLQRDARRGASGAIAHTCGRRADRARAEAITRNGTLALRAFRSAAPVGGVLAHRGRSLHGARGGCVGSAAARRAAASLDARGVSECPDRDALLPRAHRVGARSRRSAYVL